MKKPYPGMDKRLTKREALEGKEWYEGEEPEGSLIISLIPKFAQIPIELAQDSEIKLQLKGVYSILHSRCGEKSLGRYPFTFKSMERMAKEDAGVSYRYFKELIKELKEAGWVTVLNRGSRSAIIILHAYKGQKITKKQEKEFRNKVKHMIKNFRGKS